MIVSSNLMEVDVTPEPSQDKESFLEDYQSLAVLREKSLKSLPYQHDLAETITLKYESLTEASYRLIDEAVLCASLNWMVGALNVTAKQFQQTAKDVRVPFDDPKYLTTCCSLFRLYTNVFNVVKAKAHQHSDRFYRVQTPSDVFFGIKGFDKLLLKLMKRCKQDKPGSDSNTSQSRSCRRLSSRCLTEILSSMLSSETEPHQLKESSKIAITRKPLRTPHIQQLLKYQKDVHQFLVLLLTSVPGGDHRSVTRAETMQITLLVSELWGDLMFHSSDKKTFERIIQDLFPALFHFLCAFSNDIRSSLTSVQLKLPAFTYSIVSKISGNQGQLDLPVSSDVAADLGRVVEILISTAVTSLFHASKQDIGVRCGRVFNKLKAFVDHQIRREEATAFCTLLFHFATQLLSQESSQHVEHKNGQSGSSTNEEEAADSRVSFSIEAVGFVSQRLVSSNAAAWEDSGFLTIGCLLHAIWSKGLASLGDAKIGKLVRSLCISSVFPVLKSCCNQQSVRGAQSCSWMAASVVYCMEFDSQLLLEHEQLFPILEFIFRAPCLSDSGSSSDQSLSANRLPPQFDYRVDLFLRVTDSLSKSRKFDFYLRELHQFMKTQGRTIRREDLESIFFNKENVTRCFSDVFHTLYPQTYFLYLDIFQEMLTITEEASEVGVASFLWLLRQFLANIVVSISNADALWNQVVLHWYERKLDFWSQVQKSDKKSMMFCQASCLLARLLSFAHHVSQHSELLPDVNFDLPTVLEKHYDLMKGMFQEFKTTNRKGDIQHVERELLLRFLVLSKRTRPSDDKLARKQMSKVAKYLLKDSLPLEGTGASMLAVKELGWLLQFSSEKRLEQFVQNTPGDVIEKLLKCSEDYLQETAVLLKKIVLDLFLRESSADLKVKWARYVRILVAGQMMTVSEQCTVFQHLLGWMTSHVVGDQAVLMLHYELARQLVDHCSSSVRLTEVLDEPRITSLRQSIVLFVAEPEGFVTNTKTAHASQDCLLCYQVVKQVLRVFALVEDGKASADVLKRSLEHVRGKNMVKQFRDTSTRCLSLLQVVIIKWVVSRVCATGSSELVDTAAEHVSVWSASRNVEEARSTSDLLVIAFDTELLSLVALLAAASKKKQVAPEVVSQSEPNTRVQVLLGCLAAGAVAEESNGKNQTGLLVDVAFETALDHLRLVVSQYADVAVLHSLMKVLFDFLVDKPLSPILAGRVLQLMISFSRAVSDQKKNLTFNMNQFMLEQICSAALEIDCGEKDLSKHRLFVSLSCFNKMLEELVRASDRRQLAAALARDSTTSSLRVFEYFLSALLAILQRDGLEEHIKLEGLRALQLTLQQTSNRELKKDVATSSDVSTVLLLLQWMAMELSSERAALLCSTLVSLVRGHRLHTSFATIVDFVKQLKSYCLQELYFGLAPVNEYHLFTVRQLNSLMRELKRHHKISMQKIARDAIVDYIVCLRTNMTKGSMEVEKKQPGLDEAVETIVATMEAEVKLLVFYLFDLCSDKEFQVIHMLLRDEESQGMLKDLHEDYQKNFQFYGKV